ncbi:hypothetical protein [Porticoccus sp.]
MTVTTGEKLARFASNLNDDGDNISHAVANVAALVADTSPVGTVVRTLDYGDAGKGGGAPYRKVTAATAAAENYIVDELLNHTASDGNIWVHNYEDVIFAKQAGAKVDDATDDSASHQAIIDQLNARGGGTWWQDIGTSRCLNVIMRSRVECRGMRRATVLKLIDDAPLDSKVISTSAAIEANGCAVRQVEVDGNASQHGQLNNQMNAITIQGNHFDWVVEECYLHNTGGDGVFVAWANDLVTQLPENIRVIDNVVEATGRQDISIVHCKDYVVQGNICSGVIDIETGNDTETNRDGVVNDNVAFAINVAPFSGLLSDNNQLVVSGNACQFLTCFGGNNVRLEGNTVKASFRYAQTKRAYIIDNNFSRIESIVSNGNFVEYMELTNNNVLNSDTGIAAAVTLRNIKKLVAKGNEVAALGAGVPAVLIENLDSSTSEYLFKSGEYTSDSGDGIKITANTQVGCEVKLRGDIAVSGGSGASINKTGASAGGTVSVVGGEYTGDMLINFNDGLFECRKADFVGDSKPRLVNNNINTRVNFDELQFDYAPGFQITLQNSAFATGPNYIGRLVNVSGDISLDWFGSTGTPTTEFRDAVVEQTSWIGTPIGTIETGSHYYLRGDATRFGQWYNGTTWVDRA